MEENTVRIFFVGDIFPANLEYNAGFGIASQYLKHKGNLWDKNLKKILDGADFVFGNLESPLIHDAEYCNNNSFAGHQTFVEFLKRYNFNIVSIANNHILEQGIEGFHSTCKILKENKISFVGKHNNNLSNIEIIEFNNIRIGLCAFNEIHDFINSDQYAELNEDNIFFTIDELNKLDLDYKIISLHWGHEYIHYPSQRQIELAHKIIDSGVNVVIGHHPHVIQPVEEYNNGLIFYSLGNFLFDMLWSEKVRHGLVVKLEFNKVNFNFKTYSIRLSEDYSPVIYSQGKQKFDKINENYKKLLKNGYNFNYNLLSKKCLLLERVLMKKEMIKNWNKMTKQSKIKVFNKIKERFV